MPEGAPKFIKTGENEADYPIYEKDKDEPDDPEKRKTMRAALRAAIALAAGPAILQSSSIIDDKPHKEDTENLHFTNSGYFRRQLMWYGEQFEEEMPQILKNFKVLESIQEHFSVPSLPQNVQEELKDLIYGLAIEESRLKCDAKSEEGAFGCLQITPTVWKELAKKGEKRKSLEDNIRIAAQQFERNYRYITTKCHEELKRIKQVFFDNDTELFEKQFLTPLLINAYNAGMGSIVSLIKWFSETYHHKEDLKEPFEGEEEIMNNFDVFVFLAHIGDQKGIVKFYKEKSADYTFKVYAAADELKKTLDPTQKTRLGIKGFDLTRMDKLMLQNE